MTRFAAIRSTPRVLRSRQAVEVHSDFTTAAPPEIQVKILGTSDTSVDCSIIEKPFPNLVHTAAKSYTPARANFHRAGGSGWRTTKLYEIFRAA